ncbi:MAG TPA: methyltransferase domain-containing protein [Flavobacterium sp.]|nr:methyltransferase domain-containing protein [Flavobacterium sp.]
MLGLKTKNSFVDPSKILAYAGIEKGMTVADLGCGNGFYPVATGKLVGEDGVVYAVDVVTESLEATVSAAKQANLKNIYTIRHNLELPGVAIKDNSCDAVILSGILHLTKLQKNVLRETYRVLKTGGKVVVIEWKKERLPFGPSFDYRVSEEQMEQIMAQSGFRFQNEIPSDKFHYALVFVK